MAKDRTVTAVEILKYAKGLLSKRGGWTKGVFARTKNGASVMPEHSEATSFCLMGANIRAQRDLNPLQKNIYRANDALYSGVIHNSVATFNDEQKSKRPVIAVLDRAIKKLEAQHG